MSDTAQNQPRILVLVAHDPQLTNLCEHPAITEIAKLSKSAKVGVVVDISALPIMSSPGLAQLVKLRRDLGCASGWIRVAGANEDICRMLHVCHLDEFFGVDDSVEHAVRALEELGA